MISFAFLENNDVAQEKIARNLVLKLELSDTLYFQVLTGPLQHRVSGAIGISKDNPLAEIG